MNTILHVTNWLALAGLNSLIILFLVSSFKEKERRAVVLFALALAINTVLWVILNHLSLLKWITVANLTILAALCATTLLSLVKFFPRQQPRALSQVLPYDERDYMFSRNHLQFHPDLAKIYYSAHPEKKEIDEKIHRKPELGEPGHVYYDQDYSAIADAVFVHLHRTRPAGTGLPSPVKKTIDKEKISRIIQEMAYYYGAVDVGFTALRPYHFYTHKGRAPETWGEEIRSDHRTAIAITVAMDPAMIKKAPTLPTMLESSRQYLEVAKIANVIAEYIRSLGYDARAHTDGNYEVMCVPVAIDAGIGTLGRIGLLMHPVYGPCIRISVVTTILELPRPNKRKWPYTSTESIIHFCKICKKCADNCPTFSIPQEHEPDSRGFRHWSINQETCFSYWKNIGTDCGFCIRVCPYTKPNTLMHQLVRFYISRNVLNQYIALFLDDLLYERKPKISNKNSDKMIASRP